MSSRHLMCSLCLEDFDKQELKPKSLPCVHTFCRQCLVLYLQKHYELDNLPCPTCRQLFARPETGVDDLPTNFVILDLLDDDSSNVDQDEQVKRDKASLERKLNDVVQTARERVVETTMKMQQEIVAWEEQMLNEIDKVHESMKEKIKQEYAETASQMKDSETIENTPLFLSISKPISVNGNLKLEKTCSGSQLITHPYLNQENQVTIDTSARDAMLLPLMSSATMNVSQNGTVLLTYRGQSILLYKYHENNYKHEKSFTLEQEMKNSRAFFTPNGNHIVLSRTVRSGFMPFISTRKIETKTWSMTLAMKKETYHCGSFGELSSVSDTRLLYKQDASLSVYNFNHELLCRAVLPASEKKTFTRAVLNPYEHLVAAILEQKGQEEKKAELKIFNTSGGENVSQAWGLRQLEFGTMHFLVFSGTDGLMFYNWRGEFIKSFSYAGIKCPYSITSFPPDCVCQSRENGKRILHLLTRNPTPMHRKCVVACRIEF